MNQRTKSAMSVSYVSPSIITAEVIEARFLGYFGERGNVILSGSSLIDESVPMSFVMSAGLVQAERALRDSSGLVEKRFALIQSCFRHFDMLENVGNSSSHLSFFRMAGAFHFGFFDQRSRTAEVWDLLSNVFGLSADSLWVTYFSGGDFSGHLFPPSTEVCQSWLDCGFHPDHVVALSDNLWKQSRLMDSYGHPKVGPTSEVFWDRGEQLACGPDCLPGCRCGRFVEFLNMLFIGWEQNFEDHRLHPLTLPFVEMVIGIERLAMVLQRASSIYEVESLPLLASILEEFLGDNAIGGLERNHQMRLLADHLRALLFLVADGAPPPGRGGRARIMRRLARNLLVAQKLLDLPLGDGNSVSPAITVLLDQLLNFYRTEHPQLRQKRPRMMAAHPNLIRAPAKLVGYLNVEGKLFEHTLENGINRVNSMLLHRVPMHLSGKEILELEVSYGVPISYLKSILDKKEIAYSLLEYQSARRRWQEDNALKEGILA